MLDSLKAVHDDDLTDILAADTNCHPNLFQRQTGVLADNAANTEPLGAHSPASIPSAGVAQTPLRRLTAVPTGDTATAVTGRGTLVDSAPTRAAATSEDIAVGTHDSIREM